MRLEIMLHKTHCKNRKKSNVYAFMNDAQLFITLTPFSNEIQIRADMHSFVHRIRLYALFRSTQPASNQKECFADLVRQPSHWTSATD